MALQHTTSSESTPATQPLKQEVATPYEQTYAGKTFTPPTDIYETKTALTVTMDMPGVTKEQLTVRLENDQLEIEGRVSPKVPGGREAVYSEYNIGNYYRRFTLSNRIARDAIEAKIQDGVLTLVLPKMPEAAPRTIQIH